MQQLLNEILDEVRPLVGRGKIANYTPAFAGVEPNQLRIAVYNRDGEPFHTDGALRPSPIRSISKVFSLIRAIQHSDENVWQHLGHEPSGQLFNSLVQLEFECGKPRDPFVNAGALVIYDIDQSHFAAPTQSMRDFVRRLRGNPEVVSDSVMARSEYQHRSRNTAAAYLMRSSGSFHNDVEAVLLSYFHHCMLRMSCVDLAQAFCFLADKGFYKHSNKQVLDERQTRQVNAIMATNRLYDEAGDFAYQVDLPGRSGVGGSIIVVVPGRFTICIWSPEPNAAGNSLAGVAVLEKLSERIDWSVS